MNIDPFWIAMGMIIGVVVIGPIIAGLLFKFFSTVITAMNDHNPQMAEALAINHVQHDRYEPQLLTYFNRKIYKRVWQQEMSARTPTELVSKE
ncbi:hypothetical protein D0C16_08010 [Cellvibrio sp. KY-GH-1]|uniref:hypothetical protein n=1 Tax=Cellvibrio sp. KY-GH-1 TaxID=2303332 RepID=UPI00124604B6|nr:hypothetical protein [Cellvibrio sp. KY-GH-1]QEY15919.1 hypothetical protein D0C16_08010 [Cellvibrio sp. KY-GH-1]